MLFPLAYTGNFVPSPTYVWNQVLHDMLAKCTEDGNVTSRVGVPPGWVPSALTSHLPSFSNSAEPSGCEETRHFFGNEKLNIEQIYPCLLTPCWQDSHSLSFTGKEE